MPLAARLTAGLFAFGRSDDLGRHVRVRLRRLQTAKRLHRLGDQFLADTGPVLRAALLGNPLAEIVAVEMFAVAMIATKSARLWHIAGF